ncbi:MAG: potassium channel protein [Syntrophorhabdaceae bacterium]|nr:potassium channel protein [Syntrophorhabdaceae bacterium]
MVHSIPKKLRYITIAIFLVVFVGTVGFKISGGEKTTFLDALYMTAITISTVGYGDVIGLDNKPLGKIFAIVFIFLGTGFMAYLFTTLAAYIIEGELKKVFRRRQMEKRIEKLKNHYIVCGAGMVGLYIVHELYHTRRHQVVIDINENKIEELKIHNIKDVDMIIGDATENDVLEKAMIHKAAGLFATTNSDNDNIVIILTARQLNPKMRIVARCTDTKNVDKMKRAGADNVVALNYIGGMRMASEMIRPHVTSFLDKMLRDKDSHLRVEEVHIPDNSPYLGMTVGSIDFRSFGNILLIAVRKADGEWIYNPRPETTIEKHMSLIILATAEEREILQALVSEKEE